MKTRFYFVFILLSAFTLYLSGCGKTDPSLQAEEVLFPSTDAVQSREGIEQDAWAIFQSSDFRRILQVQGEINSKVLSYLSVATKEEEVAFRGLMEKWEAHQDFTEEEVSILSNVLALSDKTLLAGYADSLELHWVRLVGTFPCLTGPDAVSVSIHLGELVAEYVGDDYSSEDLDVVGFRSGCSSASCGGCTIGPNCNPEVACWAFRLCRSNAWNTAISGIVSLTALGGTLGSAGGPGGVLPGAGIGFSFGTIGYGIYLGHTMAGCLGQFSAACRFCGCH